MLCFSIECNFGRISEFFLNLLKTKVFWANKANNDDDFPHDDSGYNLKKL